MLLKHIYTKLEAAQKQFTEKLLNKFHLEIQTANNIAYPEFQHKIQQLPNVFHTAENSKNLQYAIFLSDFLLSFVLEG